jgi:hypothetical protein
LAAPAEELAVQFQITVVPDQLTNVQALLVSEAPVLHQPAATPKSQ